MEVLSDLTVLSILLAAITGIVCWRSLPLAGKLIACQVALAFVTESGGEYLSQTGHKSNLWLYDIYILLEFVLLITAGYLLGGERSERLFLIISLALFLGVWGYYAVTDQFVKLFNYTYVVGCLLLVLMYLIRLMQMLRNDQHDRITLLICYSTLFYFACVIPLFGFRDFIHNQSMELGRNLSIINLIMNVIRYNLIVAAFVISFRKQKLVGR